MGIEGMEQGTGTSVGHRQMGDRLAPGVLTVGVMLCSSARVTLWYMLPTSLRTSSYSDTVICTGWARLSPSHRPS